jgi:nucleotide-binding universal stress UspA family protein
MVEYPEYKKVLFCTDFSENADYAFDFACGIARRDKGLLYILHVIPYNYSQVYACGETLISEDVLRKMEKAREKDLANNYEEHYKKKIEKGFPNQFITKTGRENEEIVAFAKQEQVDIIVMGTHGKTGIEHVFFGSVAEKVLRYSPFPVLVIPCKKRRKRA